MLRPVKIQYLKNTSIATGITPTKMRMACSSPCEVVWTDPRGGDEMGGGVCQCAVANMVEGERVRRHKQQQGLQQRQQSRGAAPAVGGNGEGRRAARTSMP